jgi:hypothetical protein
MTTDLGSDLNIAARNVTFETAAFEEINKGA